MLKASSGCMNSTSSHKELWERILTWCEHRRITKQSFWILLILLEWFWSFDHCCAWWMHEHTCIQTNERTDDVCNFRSYRVNKNRVLKLLWKTSRGLRTPLWVVTVRVAPPIHLLDCLAVLNLSLSTSNQSYKLNSNDRFVLCRHRTKIIIFNYRVVLKDC